MDIACAPSCAHKGLISDEKNGLLTVKGDEKDLAAKLLILLENSDVGKRLRKREKYC